MAGLCEGGNEPLGSLKTRYLLHGVLQFSERKATTFRGNPIIPKVMTLVVKVPICYKCERPKIMFTKLEQRSWIKIEVARGRSAQECFQGLREACGDAALPYRTVARWVKAFREGLVGSAVKMKFIVAYDIDGVILHHAVPPRQTVNADYYCRFLQHHLRPALRRKRRHLVVQNPIILHDNARSHTAAAVKDLLRRWQWEILEHPPYSPDMIHAITIFSSK
ncbi:hypothetical protein ANN_20334 [Periplaneta americana]|uniref:Mos1 transposase HTH domain-containing protein n=1 Tax=Periplaneta americana TaxID=6978 RepID=A0ABQ8SCR3_PERAM|nr:hypothetical protein ANN_20334 [Periplaneta americana]